MEGAAHGAHLRKKIWGFETNAMSSNLMRSLDAGCTKPLSTGTRLMYAGAGGICVGFLVALVDSWLFRKKPHLVMWMAAITAVLVAVLLYARLKDLRGNCRRKDLFEFFTTKMQASEQQAATLLQLADQTSTTYVLVLVVWFYACLRLN